MWRDQCVVSGEPAVPVIVPAGGGGSRAELRGRGGVSRSRRPRRDLRRRLVASPGIPRPPQAPAGSGSWTCEPWSDTLSPAEAALLGYARGILYWHRHQRYCGSCGPRLASATARTFRTCLNEACARLHFPRVEPAVIMLVENQGRCLLARHKGSAPRSYSTLAPSGVGESPWRTRCDARSPKSGRARRVGDVHGLAGLAVPVRADDRVPGHRAGGDRSRRRRGSDRGPLVYPRRAHRARHGGLAASAARTRSTGICSVPGWKTPPDDPAALIVNRTPASLWITIQVIHRCQVGRTAHAAAARWSYDTNAYRG